MLRRESATTDLRDQLNHALHTGQLDEALKLYELIEARKPTEPRWCHRKGDLLLRMGRKAEAVLAYERAASLYAEKGFEARAAATARFIRGIDLTKPQAPARKQPNRLGKLPARIRQGTFPFR